MTVPGLILASSSVGRKHLLERLGIPFSVMPSTVDEDAITCPDSLGINPRDKPVETIRLRARAKCEDIIKKITSASYKLPATSSLVIAADSMAIYKSKLYGKPKDNTDARRILGILMGQTFQFFTHTVMVVVNSEFRIPNSKNNRWEQTVQTDVTFRKMSDQEVNLYLKTYDVTKFAGAFATELAPWDLITKIDGSFTNVIGLPFEAILPVFTKTGLLS